MDKWIIELFGINRLNFYGWIFAGCVVIVVSVALGLLSFVTAQRNTTEAILIMLGAIGFLLLGILSVLLQIYCSLLAEKLQKKDELLSHMNEPRNAREEFDESNQLTHGTDRDQYATKA
jgi:hypothetical protein